MGAFRATWASLLLLCILGISVSAHALEFRSAETKYIRFEQGTPVYYDSPEALGAVACAFNGWGLSYVEEWSTQPGTFNIYCVNDLGVDHNLGATIGTFVCAANTTSDGVGKCTINGVQPDLMAGDPDSCSGSPSAGNPVILTTGKKYQKEIDVQYTKSPLAQLFRTFNTGFGWRLSYMSDVKLLGANGNSPTIEYTENSGRKHIIDAVSQETDSIGLSATFTTNAEGEPDSYAVKLANGSVELFNADGDPLSVVSPSGDSLSYEYSGDVLVSIESNRGDLITFGAMNADGHFPESITVNGLLIEYGFDAEGHLTSVTYADGSTKQYQYDDNSNLTGIVDENGHQASEWQYDDEGRVTLNRRAGGVDEFQFSYTNYEATSNSGTVRVTNPLGRNTIHQFQRYNGRRKMVSSDGEQSTLCPAYNKSSTFDANGNMTSTIDHRGILTSIVRDEQGRVIGQTEEFSM